MVATVDVVTTDDATTDDATVVVCCVIVVVVDVSRSAFNGAVSIEIVNTAQATMVLVRRCTGYPLQNVVDNVVLSATILSYLDNLGTSFASARRQRYRQPDKHQTRHDEQSRIWYQWHVWCLLCIAYRGEC